MIKVHLRYLNISPRKVRMVVNMIKGMDVIIAEKQLLFSPKRSAKNLLKLLKHAIDVAEKQKKIKKEDLFIKNIIVNEGPKQKRFRAMSRGHVGRIIKRTSHITLELDKKNGS
ncbi:MAG: 50S ribosomal protein L22 [Candidatus Parcubacteria bacterium]|nr:MAG: 50S ribosomal protein L22 [Candidatus Parcubacteria bacterium]